VQSVCYSGSGTVCSSDQQLQIRCCPLTLCECVQANVHCTKVQQSPSLCSFDLSAAAAADRSTKAKHCPAMCWPLFVSLTTWPKMHPALLRFGVSGPCEV
jgi:hypothetical protein